ncbi:hypothetical protein CVT26_011104 [Gymnopilus dilepis]|uniref:Uncharacterized protein n=1 Tax=Gymnopilus dilepis TaxID=231916 RepID=A0A409WRL6_9AGAR|nr:hypothetical protein CVT26_011104 [Gymnopilus dilepis]
MSHIVSANRFDAIDPERHPPSTGDSDDDASEVSRQALEADAMAVDDDVGHPNAGESTPRADITADNKRGAGDSHHEHVHSSQNGGKKVATTGGRKRPREISPGAGGNISKKALLSPLAVKTTRLPTFTRITRATSRPATLSQIEHALVGSNERQTSQAANAGTPRADKPSDDARPTEEAVQSSGNGGESRSRSATPSEEQSQVDQASESDQDIPHPDPPRKRDAAPPKNQSTATQRNTHPMNIVAVPAGGWSKIRGPTFRTLRQHLHLDLAAAWDAMALEGPTMYVYVADFRLEADCSPTARKIKDLVAAIILKDDFRVSIPQKAMGIRTPESPIYPFLLSELTQDDVDHLLSEPLWSNRSFTIFTAPSKPFVSDYVMTLQNLPFYATSEDEELVAESVRKFLREDEWIASFIHCHHDAYHSHYHPDDVLDETVDNTGASALEININKDEKTTLFNVYIPPPTHNLDAHEEWITYLRQQVFVIKGNMANVREAFNCSHCKGHDHPSGLCPLFGTILARPTGKQPSTPAPRANGYGGKSHNRDVAPGTKGKSKGRDGFGSHKRSYGRN